ncbi:MAG: plasmid pRiA4b ORF-3 family protein [Amoebophilaceae bacterium]|nr:plasmid pRiA4b ORF-3 family protein [Amoebophilaceae bacterium]
MAIKISTIYQFKIILKYTKPKIWRRIQVPEKYNFEDLHFSIQSAMGWEDYHLHKFEIINPKTGQKDLIGIPNDEAFLDVIPEDKAEIAQYFLSPKDKATYEYDFGDGWQHEIVLENILPAVACVTYPQCLAGERACPPEDCGGVGGYEYLLKIIADPNHEEYEERIEWLDDDFNPEYFDHKLVNFSNST